MQSFDGPVAGGGVDAAVVADGVAAPESLGAPASFLVATAVVVGLGVTATPGAGDGEGEGLGSAGASAVVGVSVAGATGVVGGSMDVPLSSGASPPRLHASSAATTETKPTRVVRRRVMAAIVGQFHAAG